MRITASWYGAHCLNRIQGRGTISSFAIRGLPSYRHPDIPSVPSCSEPSRRGLETLEQVSCAVCRPILTAPARAGVGVVRSGRKKAFGKVEPKKEMRRKCCKIELDFENPIQGFSDVGGGVSTACDGRRPRSARARNRGQVRRRKCRWLYGDLRLAPTLGVRRDASRRANLDPTEQREAPSTPLRRCLLEAPAA